MERWLAALSVYRDRRILCILFLGFSSGLPLLLTLSTLSTWMATRGVDRTTIGLFALVGLPYALKFLWSPLIDGIRVPLLARWLGLRRGWAVTIQLALMGAILLLGASDPEARPLLTALAALGVAFLSASQDIVVDAYRVEILEESRQGAGAAAIQVGYRLGMLAAGAGALFIAEALGWFAAYCVMAALVSVGIATILMAKEPRPPAEREARSGEGAGGLRGWLNAHVLAPFADFAQRPVWPVILLFVVLFKFGDAIAGVMANPFYIDIGFSLSEIASVSKIFGLLATLSGAVAGGVVVARFGILKGLLLCGLLQMVSNLMFAVQASVGHSVPLLVATIGIENVAGGMGSAAFVAYLSSLCSFGFAATQYALLSSLTAVGRTVLSSGGGFLADRMDWVSFFVVSTFAALPGLLILLWLLRLHGAARSREGARG